MLTSADSTRASAWSSYAGNVYDLTPFLEDHPGGDDLLLDWAGKDMGNIMADETEHVHSRSAYEMMEEYKIGELGGDEKIVSEGEHFGSLHDYHLLLLSFRSIFIYSPDSSCCTPGLCPLEAKISHQIQR
jgi:cytochrome b involved in lipid metabolism